MLQFSCVVVMKPWPSQDPGGALLLWCQLIEIAAILLAATEQLLSNNVCQTLVSGPHSDSKLQQHMGPEQSDSFKDSVRRVSCQLYYSKSSYDIWAHSIEGLLLPFKNCHVVLAPCDKIPGGVSSQTFCFRFSFVLFLLRVTGDERQDLRHCLSLSDPCDPDLHCDMVTFPWYWPMMFTISVLYW